MSSVEVDVQTMLIPPVYQGLAVVHNSQRIHIKVHIKVE